MATKKISDLTSASALSGSEVLPVMQGGVTKKVTAQAIAALAGGGSASTFDITANGLLGGDSFSVSYTSKAIINTSADATNGYSAEIGNFASFGYNANNPGGYGGGYGSYTTATNVSFGAKYLGDVALNGGTGITTFLFPEALQQSGQMGNINFSGSGLTTANFAKLTSSTGITINQCPSFTTINCPALVKFPSWSGFNINGTNNITSLTSANFPVLEDLQIMVYEPGHLATIDLPSVKNWKGLYIATQGMNTGVSAVTTINFPNIEDYTNPIQIGGNYALTNVTIGTVGVTKKVSSGWKMFDFNNCNLSQASVDNILTVLASLDGTNGTTSADNGTINLTGGNQPSGMNAAPSAAGLAAKAVLLGRGWTVSHQ